MLTTDKWRAFVDGLPADVDIPTVRNLNKQYDAGFITQKQFHDQLHELVGRIPDSVEAQAPGEALKNTILLAYIAELAASHKIGLISNIGSDWITDSFLTKTEQNVFDDMIFSHNVGMTKPDPRIFELACEHLQVSPSEAIMVDDVMSYCQAAQAVGMQAIIYDNFQQFKAELEAILHHT